MHEQIDTNYNTLYRNWTSDKYSDKYTQVSDTCADIKEEETDTNQILKNQYNTYKTELKILMKVKKFIEDDIRIKGVILNIVADAIDEDDEDEDSKFRNQNKDKYYDDYYILYDIVRLFGDDHTLVLLDNFINLEKVEMRIKSCYESMGWIAEEIF